MNLKTSKRNFRVHLLYADFESILKPTKGDDNITHNHIPCGFTFKTISRIPEYNNFKPISYRGEDTMKIFLNNILKQKDIIISIMTKERKK